MNRLKIEQKVNHDVVMEIWMNLTLYSQCQRVVRSEVAFRRIWDRLG